MAIISEGVDIVDVVPGLIRVMGLVPESVTKKIQLLLHQQIRLGPPEGLAAGAYAEKFGMRSLAPAGPRYTKYSVESL